MIFSNQKRHLIIPEEKADFTLDVILEEEFGDIQTRILFFLRMELLCHCAFFLNGIHSSSYWLENDTSRPERFVLELNNVRTLSICSNPFRIFAKLMNV